MSRTICHARACNAHGTLLVSFWPLLCPDGRHLAPLVHAWYAFSYRMEMFLPGHSGSNIGDSLNSEAKLLSVYNIIDFSRTARLYNINNSHN